MTYSPPSEVKNHKDRLWTSLLQYCSGHVTKENVESSFRSLFGDAVLWVHNNHEKLDIEKMKQIIANIKIEGLE